MKKIIILIHFCVIFTINMIAQTTIPPSCTPDTLNKVVLPVIPEEVQVLPPLGPPVTPPVSPVLDSSEYRMVYWVHGMNGDESAWSRASAASSELLLAGQIPGFQPRKIISHLVDYSNVQTTLDQAAVALNGDLVVSTDLPQDYDKNKSFVIAHSQGGLTTRAHAYHQLQKGLPLKYGGFVTFGTPHRGAAALTGYNKVLGYDFFKTAALDLSAGPVQEVQNIINKINRNFFLRLFNKEIDVDVPEKFESLIETLLFHDPITNKNGFLLDLISNEVESGISKEMAIGSPTLTRLNAFDPGIPSAAFYGVKKNFIHPATNDKPDLLVEPMWALMHYSLNSPNDNDYFQAYDDWMLADKAREMQLDYLLRSIQYGEVVDILEHSICISYGLFSCTCDPKTFDALDIHPLTASWAKSTKRKACRKVNKTGYIADYSLTKAKYYRGVNWVTQASTLWEIAIGGITEKKDLTNCSCTLKNKINGSASTFSYTPVGNIPCGTNMQDNQMPFPDWTVWDIVAPWQSTYRTTIIRKEHDGAALAETVRDLPFMTDDMKDDEGNDLAKMEGSGHMQMRNDGNLKNALNHVFNGNVGDHFYTKPIGE